MSLRFDTSYLRSNLRHDALSSIVVFLVALPLCIGITIASGAPTGSGIVTGIIAGILVGWLSGCPLQVSGPAAGLTVIVFEIIREQGLEAFGVIVIAAGRDGRTGHTFPRPERLDRKASERSLVFSEPH